MSVEIQSAGDAAGSLEVTVKHNRIEINMYPSTALEITPDEARLMAQVLNMFADDIDSERGQS